MTVKDKREQVRKALYELADRLVASAKEQLDYNNFEGAKANIDEAHALREQAKRML